VDGQPRWLLLLLDLAPVAKPPASYASCRPWAFTCSRATCLPARRSRRCRRWPGPRPETCGSGRVEPGLRPRGFALDGFHQVSGADEADHAARAAGAAGLGLVENVAF